MPKKYAVVYALPSGWWTTYTTDNLAEANVIRASEQARTGYVHKVVTP